MINMEISQQLQIHPSSPAKVAMHTTEASTETLKLTFHLRSSSTFSLEEGFPQVSSRELQGLVEMMMQFVRLQKFETTF